MCCLWCACVQVCACVGCSMCAHGQAISCSDQSWASVSVTNWRFNPWFRPFSTPEMVTHTPTQGERADTWELKGAPKQTQQGGMAVHSAESLVGPFLQSTSILHPEGPGSGKAVLRPHRTRGPERTPPLIKSRTGPLLAHAQTRPC